MEINNNEKINEIFCKKCGVSNLVAKFSPRRLVCCKCCSIQNNQRLKKNNYYKQYYQEYKDEYLEKSKKYYNEVVKPSKHPNKIGRPRKIREPKLTTENN